jgi:hypothetical protein
MDAHREDPPALYEAPTIVCLGTLAELTQGPSPGVDDAVGGFIGGSI